MLVSYEFLDHLHQDETLLLIQSDAVTKVSHLDMKVAFCCYRCPLPGCLQRHVTVNDLEEHRELKLHLGRALQET
jgi:hypothetical protein